MQGEVRHRVRNYNNQKEMIFTITEMKNRLEGISSKSANTEGIRAESQFSGDQPTRTTTTKKFF